MSARYLPAAFFFGYMLLRVATASPRQPAGTSRLCRNSSEVASAIQDPEVLTALLQGLVRLDATDFSLPNGGPVISNKPQFTIGAGSGPAALHFGGVVSAIIVPTNHTLELSGIAVTGAASIAELGDDASQLPDVKSTGLGSWPSLVLHPNATVVFTSAVVYYLSDNCSEATLRATRERFVRRYGEQYIMPTDEGDVYIGGTHIDSLRVLGGQNYSQVLGNYTLITTNITGRCYVDPFAPVAGVMSSPPAPAPPPTAAPTVSNPYDQQDHTGPSGTWKWILVGCAAALLLAGGFGVAAASKWRVSYNRRRARETMDCGEVSRCLTPRKDGTSSRGNTDSGRLELGSANSCQNVSDARTNSSCVNPGPCADLVEPPFDLVAGLWKSKLEVLEGLHMGPIIGTGGFGRVYKARWGASIVAVKVVEQQLTAATATSPDSALREADIVSTTLTHPNVVSTYKVWTVVLQQLQVLAGSGVDQSSDLEVPQRKSSGRCTSKHSECNCLHADSTTGPAMEADEKVPELASLHAGHGKAAAGVCMEENPHASCEAHRCSSAGPSHQKSRITAGGDAAASEAVATGSKALHLTKTNQVACEVQEEVAGDTSFAAAWKASPSSVTSASEEAGEGSMKMAHEDTCCAALLQTWMAMEYCDGGCLCELIKQGRLMRKSTGECNLRCVYLCLLDIASGMSYLHSSGVVHGDLKPSNILLKSTATDPRGFVCKIADFGLSRVFCGTQHSHTVTETMGTLQYMPPELLAYGKLTKAADVYAFAMIAWELLCGQLVSDVISVGQLIMGCEDGSCRPPVPPHCPPQLERLLKRCWDADPRNRPIFSQVIDDVRQLQDEHRMMLSRQQAAALEQQHSS